MKSNPSKYNPAKQDFIAYAISSTAGGFHPSKTDLTARYSVKSITLNCRVLSVSVLHSTLDKPVCISFCGALALVIKLLTLTKSYCHFDVRALKVKR